MGGATAPKAVSVPMPFAAATVSGALFRCIARPLPMPMPKTAPCRRQARSLVVPDGHVVPGAIPPETLQESDQRWLHPAQLFQVRAGHAAEDGLGFRREREQR